jgi:hypothetical protein
MSEARARAAARELAGAGRLLAARRADLGAELEAAAADRPWGDDRGGQAFDGRYRAVERPVLEAWEQLAAYVEGLGEAARRSASEARS